MDCRIEWSPEAIEDAEAIAEFIGRDSPYYARAVIAKIVSVSRSMADFPNIGRVVPEIGVDNIREQFVYSYQCIYRVEPNRILVVAIVHGKRLLESLATRFILPDPTRRE
jgi:toxin ParE1/3/4